MFNAQQIEQINNSITLLNSIGFKVIPPMINKDHSYKCIECGKTFIGPHSCNGKQEEIKDEKTI